MQITSRFDINDKVWFYYNGKYYEGVITEINSWNISDAFIYQICHDSLESTSFIMNIKESNIYALESDIPQPILVHYQDPADNPDPDQTDNPDTSIDPE